MAGRAGRNTDAFMVQVHENVLAVDVFEGNVRRVWQTFGAICADVETRVRNVCEDLVFETVAQAFDKFVIGVGNCELARSAESDDVWNGGCAGASTLLLRAADDERRQRQS